MKNILSNYIRGILHFTWYYNKWLCGHTFQIFQSWLLLKKQMYHFDSISTNTLICNISFLKYIFCLIGFECKLSTYWNVKDTISCITLRLGNSYILFLLFSRWLNWKKKGNSFTAILRLYLSESDISKCNTNWHWKTSIINKIQSITLPWHSSLHKKSNW